MRPIASHRDRLTWPARKKDDKVQLLGDPPAHRRLIVLPAWNEEAAIGGCLEEIRGALPDWDVVVVSDGSTDNTSVVARAMGVPVIDLPFNLGVGGARRAGFSYAIREGYTEVLQIDADGQHDPAEVRHLVDVMAETQADVVIGARFAGRGDYSVTGPRKWAMKLLSAVLSGCAGRASRTRRPGSSCADLEPMRSTPGSTPPSTWATRSRPSSSRRAADSWCGRPASSCGNALVVCRATRR